MKKVFIIFLVSGVCCASVGEHLRHIATSSLNAASASAVNIKYAVLKKRCPKTMRGDALHPFCVRRYWCELDRAVSGKELGIDGADRVKAALIEENLLEMRQCPVGVLTPFRQSLCLEHCASKPMSENCRKFCEMLGGDLPWMYVRASKKTRERISSLARAIDGGDLKGVDAMKSSDVLYKKFAGSAYKKFIKSIYFIANRSGRMRGATVAYFDAKAKLQSIYDKRQSLKGSPDTLAKLFFIMGLQKAVRKYDIKYSQVFWEGVVSKLNRLGDQVVEMPVHKDDGEIVALRKAAHMKNRKLHRESRPQ